jgi:hypothetical protein
MSIWVETDSSAWKRITKLVAAAYWSSYSAF